MNRPLLEVYAEAKFIIILFESLNLLFCFAASPAEVVAARARVVAEPGASRRTGSAVVIVNAAGHRSEENPKRDVEADQRKENHETVILVLRIDAVVLRIEKTENYPKIIVAKAGIEKDRLPRNVHHRHLQFVCRSRRKADHQSDWGTTELHLWKS